MARPAHLFGIARNGTPREFPNTFPETLAATARLFPDKGIQILDRAGRHPDRRHYADLLAGVKAAAGRWQALGLQAGDRVLLCLPTSWDFVDAWLGAICSGIQPAAIAPAMGGLTAGSNFAERLERYRSVIDASRIYAPQRMVADLREQYPDSLGAIALSPEDFNAAEPEPAEFAPCRPEDSAFMQYTSGSTGTPRAVVISHGMATHNAFAINEGIGHRYGAPASEWTELHSAWLPMHHDMGLIGCLLLSIANGLELSLMNPTTFLARPLRYLQTAHQKKAMLCGPNFGYQFCVDRLAPSDLDGLDLSQVRVAMTGSEMIRPETMAAFCALTRDTGFTPDKIMPCYGMAEATLAVTFDGSGLGTRSKPTPRSSSLAAEAAEVVSCGIPIPDTEVRIADAEGNTLQEDALGEVLVKGPAVFQGYYQAPDETAVSKRGDWLRTGDLGFVSEGELYIAGRFKEILVIRGENLMPHELEWLAEKARGKGQGGERCAAFAVEGETEEKIVLVVECNEAEPDSLNDLARSIRSHVGKALSLVIDDLVLVRRGRIPRTSSGKIQRGKLKQDYLAGNVERIPHPPASNLHTTQTP